MDATGIMEVVCAVLVTEILSNVLEVCPTIGVEFAPNRAEGLVLDN
jgi:hypothetical protein